MFDLPSWRLGGFFSFYPAYVGIINPTMSHKRALCLTNSVSERSHQTQTQQREIAQWILWDFTAWPFSVLSEPFVWPTALAVITQHDGLLFVASNPTWWAKRLSRKLSAPGIWRHSFLSDIENASFSFFLPELCLGWLEFVELRPQCALLQQ